MLDGVEGVARVRWDEKAGEQREEKEEKFKAAFKEVVDEVRRVREGREEKYLVDWTEMGNLIFCKINHQATFHPEHTKAVTVTFLCYKYIITA